MHFHGTGSNDGPALQAAFDSMAITDTLTISGSCQIVPGATAETYVGAGGVSRTSLLKMTWGSLVFEGAGQIIATGVPANIDLLAYAPPPGPVLVDGPRLTGMNVQLSGGRDAFVIATCNNAQIRGLKISGGWIVTTGAVGYAMHWLNDATLNPNGGIFNSLVCDGCGWSGGFRMDNVGDRITVRDCQATGPKASIDYSAVPGAAGFLLEACNLGGCGGILIRNGYAPSIIGNEIELCGPYDYFSDGGRGYIIDFSGGMGTTYGALAERNSLQATNPACSQFTYMMAFTNCLGAVATGNMFSAAATKINPAGAAILLYANGLTDLYQQMVGSNIPTLVYDPLNVARYRVPAADWIRP